MIKKISKWYKGNFHFIPLKLPIILGILIVLSYILYKFWNHKDGFFINLITELAGIIVTVYVVSYLLYAEEKKQWKSVEKIVNEKIEFFVSYFYYNLIKSFSSGLDPNSSNNIIRILEEGKNEENFRKFMDEKLDKSLNQYDGAKLNIFMKDLMEMKKILFEIVGFMEKRPLFLQYIELYNVAEAIEKITKVSYFQLSLNNIKDDKLLIETSSDYLNDLRSRIKTIITNLIRLIARTKK